MTRRVASKVAIAAEKSGRPAQEPDRDVERPCDRGPYGPSRRHPREAVGETLRLGRGGDQRPGHDHELAAGPGPLDVGHGDAADEALAHRPLHHLRAEGGDVALALNPLFLRIHREGHVDGEDEGDIDVRALRRRRMRR